MSLVEKKASAQSLPLTLNLHVYISLGEFTERAIAPGETKPRRARGSDLTGPRVDCWI